MTRLDENVVELLDNDRYLWLGASGNLKQALSNSLSPQAMPQRLMVDNLHAVCEIYGLRAVGAEIDPKDGGPQTAWDTMSCLLFGEVKRDLCPDIYEGTVQQCLAQLGGKTLSEDMHMLREYAAHGRMMQQIIWYLSIFDFQRVDPDLEPVTLDLR